MNKISSKQLLLIVVGTVFSPAVRLFSSFYSENASQDAWLGPLIAGTVIILLTFLFRNITKKYGFCDLLRKLKGKKGKIIGFIYILWGIFLTAIHLHYYGQRICTTVYGGASEGLFIIAMGCLCTIVLYRGIESFARMNEIIVPLIVLVAVTLLVLLSKEIDTKRLMPIDSTRSITESTLFSLGGFCYISFGLFVADNLSDRGIFYKKAIVGIVVTSIITSLIFVAVIGIFGKDMIYELDHPFFSAVKQITVGEFVQHIEAFVISLWIMSDFVIIAFIGLAITTMCEYVFSFENSKVFIVPFYATAVSVANVFSVSENKVHILSEKLFLPLNLLMLVALPVFLMINAVKTDKTSRKML